ncbi:MAG: transposase [bacterium]
MSTNPRQYHKGYWYHVYARSLDEVPLYRNDEERLWFLEKLDEIFVRKKLNVGALCLMDTHYHALVEMGSVPLDRALQGLHMSYAKHVNAVRNRSGPLFHPPPGVDIILDDAYLLQVVPYIHNNPVEAGMVNCVSDFDWHTDELYRTGSWSKRELDAWKFPPNFQGSDRKKTYLERLDEDNSELIGEEGYVGKSDEWLDFEKRDDGRKERFKDRRNQRSLNEIGKTIAQDHEVSLKALRRPGRTQPEARIRQKAMVEMYEEGHGPQAIGDFFNRNKGAVIYAVKKGRKKS